MPSGSSEAVFVVWLARLQFAKQYDYYDVDFKGPVRGLSSGGEVYFNGIKVGEVTKLSLDKANPNRVVAVAPVKELETSTHPWIQEYFLGPRGRAAARATSSERTSV